MSDEELAKAGNKEAYMRLIEKYKKYLFNIAYSLLGNEENVGDAIAEAVLKAYENIRKVREAHFFKTWMTRILINECKKIGIARGKMIYLEDDAQIPIYQERINHEEQIDLQNAFKKLSKEQYVSIMLFYYNDFKISEIADLLHIPEGTVKSRLNSAKEKLFLELKERSK